MERRAGVGSSEDVEMLDRDRVEPDSFVCCLLVDRRRSGSESEVVEDIDSADGERFSFEGGLRRDFFFSESVSLAFDSPTA